MFQFTIKWLLYLVGTLYIFIEKFRRYPNEEKDNILGMTIDEDFQSMSRFELCEFMNDYMPKKGFWELNSTTKIRLGAQLLKNSGKDNVLKK
jgi:hypothetical protein